MTVTPQGQREHVMGRESLCVHFAPSTQLLGKPGSVEKTGEGSGGRVRGWGDLMKRGEGGEGLRRGQGEVNA